MEEEKTVGIRHQSLILGMLIARLKHILKSGETCAFHKKKRDDVHDLGRRLVSRRNRGASRSS